MKRLLREPLVHFLIVGAALFAVSAVLGKRAVSAPESIVVTKGQIDSLATGFEHTWQRPATPEELEGLIQDRVREEIYYREALALGLDKEDTIIRRRLQQKLEFISEDSATAIEPTEADLRAYLEAHLDTFRAARADGAAPALDEVRDAVHREWANARRLEADEAFYRSLRKRYSVTIEKR